MIGAARSEGEVRFDRARARVGRWLAPALLIGILWLPMPGLSAQAHALAAVAAATVVAWITETIPVATTAVLAPALAVVLGVAEPEIAFAPFADPLIFLFLGGFLLAAGLARSGVDRRAALWLVSHRWVQGSPARCLIAVVLVSAGMSMWISNTATTAMLMPVGLGVASTIARACADDPELQRACRRFGGGLCLAIAYASSTGGTATPVGTGPNVIAIGLLEASTGRTLDFAAWMSFGVPLALAATLLVIIVTLRVFPSPVRHLPQLAAQAQRDHAELGPWRPAERRAVAVFGVAVLAWLMPSILRLSLGADHTATVWANARLDEGVVAMMAACLMFVLPSGRPDPEDPQARERLLHADAFASIDWSTLLLLGGGLALGKLAFDTGLAAAMARGVLASAGPIVTHPMGLLAAATLLVLLLTEVTSNTATTSMMLPVLIEIARQRGDDPTPVAVTVTLAASYAFLLPVSTPPNAIAYGSRLIALPDMIRAGIRLDAAGYVLLLVGGWVLLHTLV